MLGFGAVATRAIAGHIIGKPPVVGDVVGTVGSRSHGHISRKRAKKLRKGEDTRTLLDTALEELAAAPMTEADEDEEALLVFMMMNS